MATYTTNINLKKPAQSDKIRIADFNGNADNIDDAFGAGFGQSSKPSVNAEINSLADGIAIVSQGDVHGAIPSGWFVYVRNHSTLSNGLYVANQNISANATLSSSNLDADSSGGLNALSANITTLSNEVTYLPHTIQSGYIEGGSSITYTPITEISLLLAQYGSNAVMYSIFRASATNAPVAEIKSNSAITVSTSNGTVTIANSSTNSYRYRIVNIYSIPQA